ncbi:amino acid permease [Endozoicomonas sp. YOMI1]|uniref:amino acid permease n=1 Tax=Endozoicomonas sp. YOMI1 TaxID=2828739 RepID=UPI002147F0AB
MGFTSAVLLIIGNVIGAGTFTISGLMLSQVGHPVLVLLIWLIAGVVMLCGAACYGALARQIPESGGEYLFISRIIYLISDQIVMKQLNISSLPSPADWHIDGLSTGFIWAFFAYSGWNSVIYVASELKASQQN